MSTTSTPKKQTTTTTTPNSSGAAAQSIIANVLSGSSSSSAPAAVGPLFSGAEPIMDQQVTFGGHSMSVAEALNSLGGMSQAQLNQVQHALMAGGYYGSTNQVRFGYPDLDTQAAWKMAVISAEQFKQPLDQLLAAGANAGAGGGGAATQRQGRVGGANTYAVQTLNPDDLKGQVDAAATAVLGRVLKPAERDRMVSVIQALNAGNQESQNNARESQSRTQFGAETNAADAAVAAQRGVSGGGGGGTAAGALSPTDIAQYAYNAGFRGQALVTAVAVAMAESSGRPDAIGDKNLTTQGEQSTGLWQVNYRPHRDAGGSIRDPQKNLDPQFNAEAAFAISGQGSNFKPWTTFTNGAYKGNLGAAQAAAAAVTQAADSKVPQATLNRLPNEDRQAIQPPAPTPQTAIAQGAAGGGGGAPAPSGPLSASPDQYIAPVTVRTTDNVSTTAGVAQQIREANPGEAGAHDHADIYRRFLSLVTSGGVH